METVLKAIADWIKGILTAGIMSNLSGLFDNVNTQVGNIAQQVGTKPSSFEPRVFAMIEALSRNVVLPIAGIILTFIACYELIEMITQHISKSLLVFKDYGYQLTTTKESNIRDVDVAPEYMDFLKEYYKYWKSQKKLMGGSWQKSLDKKSSKYASSLLALRGTDFVICNDHGFPINPDSYGALVRRIGQRAGIEGLHPHMFRHTFVSILLSNPEIGVATVAAEAGHAQPSTTLAIYTQVYDKRRKEIRNQMSKELYE